MRGVVRCHALIHRGQIGQLKAAACSKQPLIAVQIQTIEVVQVARGA